MAEKPPSAALKGAIYGLLAVDAYFFLRQDWESLTAAAGAIGDLLGLARTFAASLDTLAWLVLLACFELETAWLSPRALDGANRVILHGLRMACYVLVLIALLGYLDDYRVSAAGPEQRLALADVVNASAWIVVVVALEGQVRAEEHGREAMVALLRPLLYAAYLVLLGVALFYGMEGSLLDAWDALLWIAAFFLIERNVELGGRMPRTGVQGLRRGG